MNIYILIACDRLEDTQESKLRKNQPDILAALNTYAESMPQINITVHNDTGSDDCEDWILGIEQSIKKPKQLQAPVNLFNDLAKQFAIDFEFGTVEDENREAVSYFGHEEGKGDSFMLAQYLDL